VPGNITLTITVTAILTVAVTNLTPNITPALNMVLVAYIRVDMLRLAPRRLQCASGYVMDPSR